VRTMLPAVGLESVFVLLAGKEIVVRSVFVRRISTERTVKRLVNARWNTRICVIRRRDVVSAASAGAVNNVCVLVPSSSMESTVNRIVIVATGPSAHLSMAPVCVLLASQGINARRAVQLAALDRTVPSSVIARMEPNVLRKRDNVSVLLAGGTTNVTGPVISITMAMAVFASASVRTMPPAIPSMAAAPAPPAGQESTVIKSVRRAPLDTTVSSSVNATRKTPLLVRQQRVAAFANRAGEVRGRTNLLIFPLKHSSAHATLSHTDTPPTHTYSHTHFINHMRACFNRSSSFSSHSLVLIFNFACKKRWRIIQYRNFSCNISIYKKKQNTKQSLKYFRNFKNNRS